MMDTVDYRSTPMLTDHHMTSPYHGHHHQQAAVAARMLQSPSPVDSGYPGGGPGSATAAAVPLPLLDTSYATLQPLPPTADKFVAAGGGSTGLLGGGGGGPAAGFPGFMDDMGTTYAAAYKYDKLMMTAAGDACAPPTFAGYEMMQQNGGGGYGAVSSHHHGAAGLASLYHHPASAAAAAAGYMSPNGFQLSAHHKSLLAADTKPPAPPPQMISPAGPSPGVAAYGPYSRGGGGGLGGVLLPPASGATSPLTAAYGPVFHHHHHHHHAAAGAVGSPTVSPTSRGAAALHGAPRGPLGPGRAAAAGTCHDVEEINTRDLAQKISSELKRYSIPQAVFAQRVLCRSQGTLSDLLRNPKPWSKLKSGRETFRRMWKWLQEPEYQRMSALRLAGQTPPPPPNNPPAEKSNHRFL